MKRIVSALLLSLLIVVGVFAQEDGEVTISNLSIRKIDHNLSVSFDALIPKLGSNYQLRLTPVLRNDSLSQSLTPIVVMGNKKAIINKRRKQLADKGNYWVAGKKNRLISYKQSIPYECWMNQLSLDIHRTIQGCCQEIPLTACQAVTRQLIHYDIKPLFDVAVVRPKLSALQQLDQMAPFLYPATDYERHNEIFEQQREKGALIVYFQQGLGKIDLGYKSNKQTLDQVNKVLDLIEADPNASLKKIVIVGFSSPEGTLAKNDVVATKRANSLKHFVGERVKYNSDLFELINGSEDWDGLKKLVENSDMPSRKQVLDIIENYSVQGGREVELMKLKGGNPYRYMAEHFFPQLRNAGYIQIYYESTPDAEAQQLSRAIELIKGKQYSQALPLLLSVKGKKQLENMIGVCHMMMGNYEQATTCFEQAIAQGNSDATDAALNLKQILRVQSIK